MCYYFIQKEMENEIKTQQVVSKKYAGGRFMKKKHLLALGVLVMGLACSGCSRNSGQLDGGIIRIAYNQATTHPHYQALERAGEKFKEATEIGRAHV